MKKRVTIVLEVESDDEINMSDIFIRNDLEQEINCASNFYDIVDFKTEIVVYKKEQEELLSRLEHVKELEQTPERLKKKIAEDIARRLMEGMKSC